MQQNIVSLKKCPSVFKNRARFFPSILVFNIQLFCSFFLFFNILEEHVRSRTLKAAQTVSKPFFSITNAPEKKNSAKLQLKSVQKQSVKLLISFFFLLVFFFFFSCLKILYSVIYIQQNHPFTIIFHSFFFVF